MGLNTSICCSGNILYVNSAKPSLSHATTPFFLSQKYRSGKCVSSREDRDMSEASRNPRNKCQAFILSHCVRLTGCLQAGDSVCKLWPTYMANTRILSVKGCGCHGDLLGKICSVFYVQKTNQICFHYSLEYAHKCGASVNLTLVSVCMGRSSQFGVCF